MKKTYSGDLIYSPSDLVRYIGSPFASWMDRYYLENPDAVSPDEESEDERLVAETGVSVNRKCTHCDNRKVTHPLMVSQPPFLSDSL